MVAKLGTQMKILVTGAAGFIGSHVSLYLIAQGHNVVGLDNMNDYYDVSLKEARLKRVQDFVAGSLEEDIYPDANKESISKGSFEFVKIDLADKKEMNALFKRSQFAAVINLAAQAGVRYSLENPHSYIDSNITGFLNVLEGCRHTNVNNLVYASSSSVYGINEKMPFSVEDPADHPVAIYGVTKRANELMAHSYSHLFNIATTGLRFFTVYGPWGRPDMALFMFTKKILAGEPIDVFNYGKHRRDFTYIDDIVRGVVGVLENPATPDQNCSGENPSSSRSKSPWRIQNIGNQKPVELMHYIDTLETCLGKTTKKNMLPLQPGDVPDTYADVQALIDATGYHPDTSVEQGIENFVRWYKDFYST